MKLCADILDGKAKTIGMKGECITKQRVFVTGAYRRNGLCPSLKEMLKYSEKQDIVILARDSEKNRNILKSYTETPGLEIVWGRPQKL